MDNRLLICLLFVTLSWGFMSTYAQNSTTAAQSGSGNMTTNTGATAVAGSMSTASGASAVAGSMSTASGATAVAGNMSTASGVSAVAGNMSTASGASTVAGNMTTNSGAAMAAGNTTNTTAASNMSSTASIPTTAIPVATLSTPISRTNCGSSKLCASQPSTCDPATGTGCYFISAQQQSGQLYNFEVSGDSDGYIAAGVSSSISVNGTQQAYVCANNNGVVKFFTGNITNLILSLIQTNASNVKGAINSRKIQCTFTATLPDTTVRAANYSLAVSNGTFDPNTGTFGKANVILFTNRVNLSDPTTNTTNQISGAYSATYQQPLIPALLVTVAMLTFSAL